MNPETFTHLAEQIAGKYWKTRLPDKIGRCRTQVYEYANGLRPVPKPVQLLMKQLAKH